MQPAVDFGIVDDIIDDFHSQRHAPGVQIGVLIGGKVAYFTGCGVTDCATDAPTTEERVFRIASMSKSFTAAAILQLRDQSLLQLDDPVVQHLPHAEGLCGPTSDSPPITVRHCLTMSSGLPTDDPWADREEAMPQATFDNLLARPLKVVYAPGTAYMYSNLGYAILGRVIEAITGAPFVGYATSQLLEPLGMNNTTYDYRSVPPQLLAQGYRRTRAGAWDLQTFTAPGSFSASGGVLSTVSDIARWVRWLADAFPSRDDVDQSAVLTRASRREMQQSHRLRPPPYPDAEPAEANRLNGTQFACGPSAYGYGLGVENTPEWGPISHHRGGLPGFGSYMIWHQASGLGVIGFANGTYAPVHQPARAALGFLLHQLHTRASETQVPPELRSTLALVERAIADPSTLQQPAFAGNLLLDTPLDERIETIIDARELVGERDGEADIDMRSPNEAVFRLPTVRGRLDVTIALTPTAPPRIQTFTVEAVSNQIEIQQRPHGDDDRRH